MKKLMAVVAVLAVVLVGDYFYSMYHVPPALDFHSLNLVGMDGQPVKLASMQGKKLFLNFFLTSEDSASEKMPVLEKAQAALAKDNFVFLCISDESLSKLDSFRKKTGSQLVFLHSTQKLKDLRILTLPTSYVLNQSGEMVYKKAGEKNWITADVLHEIRTAE